MRDTATRTAAIVGAVLAVGIGGWAVATSSGATTPDAPATAPNSGEGTAAPDLPAATDASTPGSRGDDCPEKRGDRGGPGARGHGAGGRAAVPDPGGGLAPEAPAQGSTGGGGETPL